MFAAGRVVRGRFHVIAGRDVTNSLLESFPWHGLLPVLLSFNASNRSCFVSVAVARRALQVLSVGPRDRVRTVGVVVIEIGAVARSDSRCGASVDASLAFRIAELRRWVIVADRLLSFLL